MWDWFLLYLIKAISKLPVFKKTNSKTQVLWWPLWIISDQHGGLVVLWNFFSRKVKTAGEAVLMHLVLTCSSTPLIVAMRSPLARSVMHFYLPAKRERMGYFRPIMPADLSGVYLWLKKGKSQVELVVGGN